MTTYIPLINNLVNPLYNGLIAKPGETTLHKTHRPVLSKLNGKKILYVCVGASTPGQISTVLEQLGAPLKNIKIVNGCTGSMDINDWLDSNSPAWSNLEDDVIRNGYTMEEVQGVIMCHDDLKDQSVAFPSAPQSLANKMESLVIKMKTEFFTNLKTVDLFSRLYGGFITDPKFKIPSCYNTVWANKLLTEKAITFLGFIAGVYITDGNGDLWTDGETVRSDGFYMKKSEMKQKGTSIHINTATTLDNRCAQKIFDNMKLSITGFN